VSGWRLARAVEQMAHGQDRMLPKHARSGISHHALNLLTPGRLVAVDRAIRAGRFHFSEPATFQADGCIIQQRLALGTQSVGRGVVVSAIALDHRGQGPPFPGEPSVDARPVHGPPGSRLSRGLLIQCAKSRVHTTSLPQSRARSLMPVNVSARAANAESEVLSSTAGSG
jgi:hypothetical protein